LADAGMVNVALKDPSELVVTVAGVVVWVVPSYLMVIVEEAEKPLPVTVTVVPTLPVEGLSVIEATMLNVAVVV
jgi:hypothetical protein